MSEREIWTSKAEEPVFFWLPQDIRTEANSSRQRPAENGEDENAGIDVKARKDLKEAEAGKDLKAGKAGKDVK